MSGPFGAIALLVTRSLRQHLVSTLITVGATGLAAGLVMAVFAIQRQSEAAFTGGGAEFDAVLGARGSQLQLVLNSVFHLETSPGNLPWSLFETIRTRPGVKRAIPYALGDNYYGYRVIGTTPARFEDERAPRIAQGRLFDPARREAVVGSFVAQQTGLRVGSTFTPYHGLTFDAAAAHVEDVYVVVGVAAPTNSPDDRVLWIPIEGIFRMSGHALRGAGEQYVAQPGELIPPEHREVSAVLLKFSSHQMGARLEQEINKQGKVATLAWPIALQMAELFRKVGWMSDVLKVVAYLVVVVAAGAILASMYNTINERRRDFAILRALGARKRVVFGAIVCEAAAIGALGALVGFVVFAAILAAAGELIRQQTGVVLQLAFEPALWITPLAMVGLGALAGVLPAYKAYATDVAAHLAPQS